MNSPAPATDVHDAPSGTPLRLLVVEDQEADFALLLATLSREGFAVEAARVEDEPAMTRALVAGRWDAVISDHALPRFSSGAAFTTLRASGLDLPFLIVSGTIGEEVAVEAMRAGADDYLIKGRLQRLGPALRNALAAAEARRARVRVEAELRASEQRLRELSSHLQQAIDDERTAIAREIHDEIGGSLTALRFDLTWIERQCPQTAERAREALATLASAQQAGQRLVRMLRPPILDAGLVPALEWQVSQFRRRTGIACEFRANAERIDLPDAAALTAYRTVQEALTNVLRHARARRVAVDLIRSDDAVSIEVRDDGIGLAPDALAKSDSFGLRGLAERAAAAGGWLDVSSAEGGTYVLLGLPLPAGDRGAAAWRAT